MCLLNGRSQIVECFHQLLDPLVNAIGARARCSQMSFGLTLWFSSSHAADCVINALCSLWRTDAHPDTSSPWHTCAHTSYTHTHAHRHKHVWSTWAVVNWASTFPDVQRGRGGHCTCLTLSNVNVVWWSRWAAVTFFIKLMTTLQWWKHYDDNTTMMTTLWWWQHYDDNTMMMTLWWC